tara:strand:- start:3191 stop:3964 length:774 start_codon:yes stop_codon:yes gene_type:complete
MYAVILAGGLGTRLSEETILKPKPMVEIGGRPILWHILKTYSFHGINNFIICCGYKGYLIKEYFANYSLHLSDVTFDIANNSIEWHQQRGENWKVTLIDTGPNTATGGRLKKVADFIKGDTFCFTYGDGLTNANIKNQIEFHQKHGKLATILAVKPPGRFGALDLEDDLVTDFLEKPEGDRSWINGGFFVLQKKVINYIDSYDMPWERDPLKRLAKERELRSYFHNSFWQPMDTLRNKNYLEELWTAGNPPWKIWDN